LEWSPELDPPRRSLPAPQEQPRVRVRLRVRLRLRGYPPYDGLMRVRVRVRAPMTA